MKKFVFGFLGIAALALVVMAAPGVQAVTSNTVKNQLNANVGSSTTTKARVMSQVCETLRERLGIIMARHQNNKEKYVELFGRLRTRLTNIISALEAKGIDVSDLKADLVILDQKIEKFKTDYAAYAEKVKNTNGIECGEVTTAIKSGLKNSRDALKTIQQDILDIRSYYQTVVRKELQQLKERVREQVQLKKPSINASDNAAGSATTTE